MTSTTDTTTPTDGTDGTASPAALMRTFAALAAAGDLDALIGLYTPDAVFQPESGINLSGHGQIRPALADFLALRPRITYDGEPDVVVTGDTALVTNRWTMQGTAPDGSTVREGGLSADVVTRLADGSWRVLIDQPRGGPIA